MRLYTRQEFMKLPPGVLFSKGKAGSWDFSDFMIKRDTCAPAGENIDFYARSFLNIEAHSSEQNDSRFAEMLRDGVSYPMETSMIRDGCFDEEDLFLVFEKDDLKELIRSCEEACKL